MALNQKVFIYSPTSIGGGSYNFSVFLQNGSFEKYLRVGDYIKDTANNRYEITTWSGYPNDFSDGSLITVNFIDNDVIPVEDTNFDSDWFTPDLEDIRPPLQTNGILSAITIFSGQNFEYNVSATWDSSTEASKAMVGDHVADSSGTIYEITYIDSIDRFSVPCRLKEVEPYGNPPNSGSATLYRPTPLQNLFTGKQFSELQINAVRNRDNYITDDNASTGGGASLTFEANCTVTEQVGDLVYLVSADTVAQSNATDDSKMPVVGFIESKPTSTTCIVVTAGILTSSGLITGADYFADTSDGAITTAPPSSTGNIVQKLGYALNSTQLFIQLEVSVELS